MHTWIVTYCAGLRSTQRFLRVVMQACRDGLLPSAILSTLSLRGTKFRRCATLIAALRQSSHPTGAAFSRQTWPLATLGDPSARLVRILLTLDEPA